MSKITLIHSRISEDGTIDGEPGDQTGREVCITEWIESKWTAAFRPCDPYIAEKIAETAADGAKNAHVGYSQKSRLTLYEAAKNVNFNLKKVTKDCNCDCSSFVAVCVIAAGIKISPDMWTGNLRETLLGTGAFIEVSPDPGQLATGDIILRKGHVAIVRIDGVQIPDEIEISTVIYAACLDKSRSGVYKAITPVYMREGNSISYRAMTVIGTSDSVYNYGYYSPDVTTPGKIWLYCNAYKDGVTYTGFVCDKWLERVKQ